MLRTLAKEKELSCLRREFISMVSQEFWTPLGIIHSSAEILEDYIEQLEHWLGERSLDDGATWQLQAEFFARRSE